MVLPFSCTRVPVIPVTFLEIIVTYPSSFSDSFPHISPFSDSFHHIYSLYFLYYSTDFLSDSLHCIPGIFHNIPVFPPLILSYFCSEFFFFAMFQSVYFISLPSLFAFILATLFLSQCFWSYPHRCITHLLSHYLIHYPLCLVHFPNSTVYPSCGFAII